MKDKLVFAMAVVYDWREAIAIGVGFWAVAIPMAWVLHP
jgi:hypothetical protein